MVLRCRIPFIGNVPFRVCHLDVCAFYLISIGYINDADFNVRHGILHQQHAVFCYTAAGSNIAIFTDGKGDGRGDCVAFRGNSLVEGICYASLEAFNGMCRPVRSPFDIIVFQVFDNVSITV